MLVLQIGRIKGPFPFRYSHPRSGDPDEAICMANLQFLIKDPRFIIVVIARRDTDVAGHRKSFSLGFITPEASTIVPETRDPYHNFGPFTKDRFGNRDSLQFARVFGPRIDTNLTAVDVDGFR